MQNCEEYTLSFGFAYFINNFYYLNGNVIYYNNGTSKRNKKSP